jgi:hypothetical protein
MLLFVFEPMMHNSPLGIMVIFAPALRPTGLRM